VVHTLRSQYEDTIKSYLSLSASGWGWSDHTWSCRPATRAD